MKKKNQGSALLHTLLLLGALLAIIAATLAIVVPERSFVQLERARQASFHLAWSGLEAGVYALEKGTSFPLADGLTRAWPANAPPDGTYEVSVSPDPNNSGETVKLFRLTSTGVLSAPRTKRTLTAVVIQENFAYFSYFSDLETSPQTGETAWWRKEEKVDGPVHTNGALNIAWDHDSPNRTPIFSDKVTSGANDVQYYPRSPSDSGEFRGIFSGGAGSLVLGANPVSFPLTYDDQKQAALAETAEPDEEGIILPANGAALIGGVFIKGSVTVRFDVEDGKQVLSLEQDDENYRLILDPQSNLTTFLRNDDPPRVYQGLPNGAIYCTDDVTSLGGTVQGRYTVCTDPEARVVITDHLKYSRDPRNGPSTDALGVISGEITVWEDAPDNLEIDGVLMAGGPGSNGSFSYEAYDRGGPKGDLLIYGGLIQQTHGPVGNFNIREGALLNGYQKHYQHDKRMMLNPPPFFPATGRYRILYWKDLH